MPSALQLTRQLAEIANQLGPIAIAWHVATAVALVALARGWRPSARTACLLLSAPLASVAAASLQFGNLFNAASFALLALAFGIVGEGDAMKTRYVVRATRADTVLGAALIAFAACYPHFVTGGWLRVLAAAPVGLLPCPTLALVAGFALLAGGFGSRVLPALLGLWAAFYAYVGMVRFGVLLDAGLLFAVLGSLALAVRTPVARPVS